MGGFGSGRYGWHTTVEQGLTLDIKGLLRWHLIEPGSRTSGTLMWSDPATGKQRAVMGFEASLEDRRAAWMRLGPDLAQEIPIVTTACQFGGLRWWWWCHQLGGRVAKLHRPPGETMFAARQFYGLTYRSQRLSPLDRCSEQQRRIYRKLRASYEHSGDDLPPRPKGMRRRRYGRLIAELYEAVELCEAMLGLDILRGRLD